MMPIAVLSISQVACDTADDEEWPQRNETTRNRDRPYQH